MPPRQLGQRSIRRRRIDQRDLGDLGTRLGAAGKDARRLLLARLVIDHRLERDDPFRISNADREAQVFACLQSEDAVSLESVSKLLAA